MVNNDERQLSTDAVQDDDDDSHLLPDPKNFPPLERRGSIKPHLSGEQMVAYSHRFADLLSENGGAVLEGLQVASIAVLLAVSNEAGFLLDALVQEARAARGQ